MLAKSSSIVGPVATLTGVTISFPTHNDGDLLLLAVSVEAHLFDIGSIDTPSGWTLVRVDSYGPGSDGTSLIQAVFWRAASSEPATLGVTLSGFSDGFGTPNVIASMLAYEVTAAVAPIEDNVGVDTYIHSDFEIHDYAPTVPSLTPGSGDIVVAFLGVGAGAYNNNNPVAQINSHSAPGGFASIVSYADTQQVLTAYDADLGAGATGALAFATQVEDTGGAADASATVIVSAVVLTNYSPTLTVTTSLDVNITGTPSNTVTASLDANVGPYAYTNTTLDALVAVGPKVNYIDLDVNIREGSGVSFPVELDVDATAPVIDGETHVLDPGEGIEYTIVTNLDPDVIEIIPGPNSFGIIEIYGFVNNGDGSGYFYVDFDPLVIPRQLSIQAKDDVDNTSDESNILVVFSADEATLNNEITIIPQRLVFSNVCDDLIDRIPVTDFINRGPINVPYSFKPTVFELRAAVPGIPITITVTRSGVQGDVDRQSRVTVVPEAEVHLVDLPLGEGRNVITASDGDRYAIVYVVATHYATVECAYAREIFNFSVNSIDEQETAIFSTVSTRLAEPYIDFADELPDIRSLQVLAAKLAIRATVNEAKTQQGVRDFLAALTLSTPIFVPETNNIDFFEPNVYPLFNAPEDFGGVDAHVWMHNSCISQWLTFVRYVNNIEGFRIIDATESEIIVEDNNGDISAHRFDFDDDECSLISQIENQTCFDGITISFAIYGTMWITLCAAAYTFDLCFDATGSYPITPLVDESGPGSLDPGFDGWDGCVVNRFDSGLALDSYGSTPSVESGLDACVFESYVVSPYVLASVDATNTALNFNISATGTGESQRPASTIMDVLIAEGLTKTVELEAIISGENTQTTDLTVNIGDKLLTSLSLDSYIVSTDTTFAFLSTYIVDDQQITTSLDTFIQTENTLTVSTDLVIFATETVGAELESLIAEASEVSTSLDLHVSLKVETSLDVNITS